MTWFTKRWPAARKISNWRFLGKRRGIKPGADGSAGKCRGADRKPPEKKQRKRGGGGMEMVLTDLQNRQDLFSRQRIPR